MNRGKPFIFPFLCSNQSFVNSGRGQVLWRGMRKNGFMKGQEVVQEQMPITCKIWYADSPLVSQPKFSKLYQIQFYHIPGGW